MKKTLAVAAVLAAFAGTAAADVTVYGKIDMGIGYDNVDGVRSVDMVSGGSSTSRFGLKGSETIGDLTVGFNYEGGINADEGTASLFKRVSQVYVKGAYGEVGFGMYGMLDSATGPYDLMAGLTASGTGYNGVADLENVFHKEARWSNAATYKSPTFAGVTLYAQVASKAEAAEGVALDVDSNGYVKYTADGDRPGAEFSHDADMYYGVGAKYQAGDFGAGLIVSQVEFKNVAGGADKDASTNVTAGVNYNFGVAKAFLAANYYDSGVKDVDQYGIIAAVTAPVMGGTLEVTAGYGEQSVSATEEEKAMMFGGFYKYPLSKQTYLYGAAGWDAHEDKAGDTDHEYHAVFGLCTNF